MTLFIKNGKYYILDNINNITNVKIPDYDYNLGWFMVNNLDKLNLNIDQLYKYALINNNIKYIKCTYDKSLHNVIDNLNNK